MKSGAPSPASLAKKNVIGYNESSMALEEIPRPSKLTAGKP